MREVKWSPNERVDIPDMTALTRGVVGENRRMLRTLIANDQHFVLRGFKVEPEAIPSTRVVVKLDNGGGVLSSAIGAESVPTLGLDHGALIGDHEVSFFTEGPAQQLLDFNGQPNGTYYVELRLVITDGANDNRIFLNPATVTEYAAPVNTRRVHSWQVQYAGAPSGGEWLPLGSVAWSGAAITSGMITDLRDLMGEGTAPYQSTVQTGTEGVPDFNRSTDRSANGLFGIAQIVRAALRQIRDLKGPTDGGVWDWFSRPHTPPGRAWPAGLTRSLRTMDTVTFRIADGAEDYADFNGTGGLEACLGYIATNSATLPKTIKILILSRNSNGQTQSIQAVSTVRSLVTKNIIIEGVDEGGGTGRAKIEVTMADGTTWLTAGSLQCKNVWLGFASTSGNAGLVASSTATSNNGLLTMKFEDCIIQGKVGPSGDRYAISGSGHFKRTFIVNGRLNLGDSVIEDCDFSSVQIEGGGLHMDNTSVSSPVATLYTNLTQSRALVQIVPTVKQPVIRGCSFNCNGSLNTIAIAQDLVFPDAVARYCMIEGNLFSNTIGAHAPYALDATYGTGWAIRIDCPTSRSGGISTALATNVIRDNFFHTSSVDAGNILVRTQVPTSIEGNKFLFGDRSVVANNAAVDILIDKSVGTLVQGNSFGPHSTNLGFGGVYVSGSDATKIIGNHFNGEASAAGGSIGSPASARGKGAAAIRITQSRDGATTNIYDTTINANTFHYWNGASASPGDGRVIVGNYAADGDPNLIIRGTVISANTFRRCSGFVVDFFSNASRLYDCSISNNVQFHSVANSRGYNFDCTSNVNLAFIGNVAPITGLYAASAFIRYYAAASGAGDACVTLFGNISPEQDIVRLSAAANDRGYNTTPDANLVNAYS